jgi:lipopolysaccharide export system protein LptA
MKTSEAAKYARWAATAAVVLALAAAGVYAWRRWQAAQAQKDAPAPVPAAVQRQSEEFSFTKVEGERTLFTIRASQVTELREGGKSLLEDVWITIYGRSGQRFDNLHASQCHYLPADGRITCAGDVQIDLESAEEAKANPGQRAIRIRTGNVWFLRETGVAGADQPVEFQFEHGHGRAVGVRYSTGSAVVRLEREVQMTLSTAQKGPPGTEPVTLTAAAMEYRRAASTMRLLGPVRASQGLRELTANTMTLEFDTAMRAQRLTANGAREGARPQLRWIEATGAEQQLVADEFVAEFVPDGRVTRVTAQGSVEGTARHGGRLDRLSAQQAVLEMDAGSEPRSLVARGGVRVESREGSRAQQLETEALQLEFAAVGGRRTLARAESLAAAGVELRDGEDVTVLRAARLATEFAADHRLRRLLGSGEVEIVRRPAGAMEQRTTAQEFAVEFGAGGQWTRAEQSGRVRFREGERTVEAGRARMVHATDTLTMEGPATVADALTRTTAANIEIDQRTGEATATGNVRTSYLQSGGGSRGVAPNLASEPAHITAEQLHVGRGTPSPGAAVSKAVYSGRARLWQGDAVIESERIELDRATQRLDAVGKVRGVFPEAAIREAARQEKTKENAETQRTRRNAENTATVVKFSAEKLTYLGAESGAKLEEAVTVESAMARLAAREITLAFTPTGGAQRVSSAEGLGGCTIRQGERRGAAERCTYSAAEGKFILSGGEPSLSDPVLGVTTGRQLTFFLADDRILVESAEGTRTVTRHRVEK